MSRIDKEVSTGFAIIANVIPIIASIKLMMSCKGLSDGQYDYSKDMHPLESQKNIG